MLFGFYKLTLACLKYNFNFVLDTKEHRCNRLEMTLRPNDENVRVTIQAKNYTELFKKAIQKMKYYRRLE